MSKGQTLTDLKPLYEGLVAGATIKNTSATSKKRSQIRIVRNRILYARAALNAKGDIAFGLRHIRKLCNDAQWLLLTKWAIRCSQ